MGEGIDIVLEEEELEVDVEADFLKGNPGKDGMPGKDGIDGYTPRKGIDYFDGKDGEQGPQGPQGPQGNKGDKGDTYTITPQDYQEIADIVKTSYVDGNEVLY